MELMRATGTGHAATRERRCRPMTGLRVALRFCACAVALAAAVVVLVTPSTAEATFGGRNGLLLMGSTERGSPKISPVARKADCDGRADLWTVRPDGSHLTRIGWGDTGMFSPMGRRLAINYGGDSCWGYAARRTRPPCRLVPVARGRVEPSPNQRHRPHRLAAKRTIDRCRARRWVACRCTQWASVYDRRRPVHLRRQRERAVL